MCTPNYQYLTRGPVQTAQPDAGAGAGLETGVAELGTIRT